MAEAVRRSGTRHFVTLPAGTEIVSIGGGRFVAAHPDNPPLLIDGGSLSPVPFAQSTTLGEERSDG